MTNVDRQATRPSVHLSYEQGRQVYDQVVARLVAKYTAHGRVLDIGCGLGHALRCIREQAPALELWGADIDEVCLAATRARVEGVGTVRLPRNGFDAATFGSQFDTCVLSHVLEHTLRPLDVLGELCTITRPGGHIILVTPNPVRPEIIVSSLLKRHYVNRGHVYAWDRSHWINFLENIARLHVVEYATDEVRLVPGRLKRLAPPVERLNILAARLLPWWSFSNIAVVRVDERRPVSDGDG
jgi:2-polyprenyl-3-methyl-5-hydroxy-6-metoxy-1,4-benzoquinol methylase